MCVPADVIEGKSAILLGMSQWNSNDLVEQIETLGHMEDQSHGNFCTQTHTHTHQRSDVFTLLIVKVQIAWNDSENFPLNDDNSGHIVNGL